MNCAGQSIGRSRVGHRWSRGKSPALGAIPDEPPLFLRFLRSLHLKSEILMQSFCTLKINATSRWLHVMSGVSPCLVFLVLCPSFPAPQCSVHSLVLSSFAPAVPRFPNLSSVYVNPVFSLIPCPFLFMFSVVLCLLRFCSF